MEHDSVSTLRNGDDLDDANRRAVITGTSCSNVCPPIFGAKCWLDFCLIFDQGSGDKKWFYSSTGTEKESFTVPPVQKMLLFVLLYAYVFVFLFCANFINSEGLYTRGKALYTGWIWLLSRGRLLISGKFGNRFWKKMLSKF